MDINKYKDRGLSGLANIGNTCYLNSCMQILSHTYELNQFLESGEYKKKLNKLPDSVILLEWDKLRELMWSSNCTVAPHGFVKAVQKIASIKHRDIFTGHAQNDIQEFLLFIVDCFHNALAREVDMQIKGNEQNNTDKLASICFTMMKNMYKKEYSEMLNIFYGIHISEILSVPLETDTAVVALSSTPEPFSVISLSIPKDKTQPTLYDCFDLYCEPELLTGENAWFDSNLGKKIDKTQRRICFWSLPEIMIIDLKRWNGYTHKSHILVDVPLYSADFSKYVKGYNQAAYVYDLFGVCNHGGGVYGGHYTAYIKNANGKWYDFNDTLVSEVKESSIISPRSYCLFYRKKKINLII